MFSLAEAIKFFLFIVTVKYLHAEIQQIQITLRDKYSNLCRF